jgi:hypothetical protein
VKRVLWLALLLSLAGAVCGGAFAKSVRHYVFFGADRERIHEAAFLGCAALEGAQLKYFWKALEPEKDRYDFREIRQDLAFLKAHHKKLFVQLQDATFSPANDGVPAYLRNDPRYHGGADPQYSYSDDDEARAVPAGWVARCWDPAVRERFEKLLAALGKEFDGKIEGINLPETAADFGETGRLYPKGFTPAGYRDAVIANMKALKRAFPHSVVMQYANFMPGEWLPENDHAYLRDVYRAAARLGAGVGGPDLLPFRKGQLDHSYPLIRGIAGEVPTGIAVQDGNYEAMNPRTGKRIALSELLRFAQDYLKVDYIFWCDQEPYYSKELIPFLNHRS